MSDETPDCVVADHWVDAEIGGTHDGGLPEDPRTPCVTADELLDEWNAGAGDLLRLRAETADLRGWKDSAMAVLADWDRVFDALGQPGPLGRSKAANALAELDRLSAENERLREALRKLLNRMTDRGSIGGVDSHLRTTWFSVAEVERLRASLSETGGEAQEAPTNVVTLVRGLPVTPEFGHPAWSDGRPILIGDDVLVDEVDALDDDGNEHVMHRVIGWVHSVTPEEIGVVGLWRDSDEIYEASPNELTRRETGGEGA